MNYEEREAERERQEAKREAERLARPLVERLRDSGTFRASDGLMSIKTGDYRDAHEAADLIEKLMTRIEQIQDLHSCTKKHCDDPLCDRVLCKQCEVDIPCPTMEYLGDL